ncbi:Nn.00g001540.m01.CDS01 [Neocucurbitaria sp. VM-36]
MSHHNAPTIPNGYTQLRHAGQGTHARVFTSLPNPTLTSAQTALDNGAQPDLITTALLSHVVAVKVSYTGSLRSEVRILNAVQTQFTRHKGSKHCAQLLDYERTAASPRWLVMATTPICCNMRTFCEELPGPLPKAVLWLVVTQLYDAFWFLHREREPAIAHLDIGQSNFTIGYASADSSSGGGSSRSVGPPKITLVDFGSAAFVPEAENMGRMETREDDVVNFCYEIFTLCLECCDGSGKPSGVGAEKMERFMRIWSDVTSLELLWAEFGGFAEEQLALVEEQEWQRVKDLLLLVVQRDDGREGSMRDAICQILEL